MREPPANVDAPTQLAGPPIAIPGYTLGRHVSTGGMGVVYEARGPDGKRVAVKVMRVGLHDLGLARFAREAEFLSALDHPAIVACLGHGPLEDGHAYLVMEWLDGEDLATRLRRGPLAVGDSIALGRRLAGALAAVHARGLVHRDIKPGNIFLVDGDPHRAKLLDFGVAREDGAATLTQVGALVGTLGYMAPEQARGEREIDGRADLFALGCVLYECLAGQPAFAGREPLAVLARLLVDHPPALRSLRPDVPPALEQLIAALLDKHPDARPRDLEARLAGVELDPYITLDSPPAPLIGVERRFFVVLLARLPGFDPNHDPSTGGTLEAHPLDRFVALTRPFRVDFSPLLGGTLLISADIDGPASDHASELARRALAVRAAFPAAAFVLSAGDGTRSEHALAGRVLDAAAARLTGVAAGEIALDPALAGLLAPRFELDDDGQRLLAERDTPTTRTVLGKQTPFVGRTRELGVVMATFAAALDEPRSHAVLIAADAGLGKSRLLREALARIGADVPEALVLAAHAVPFGETAVLGMVVQLLHRLVGRAGEGEPLTARLAARLAEVLPVPEAREAAAALARAAGDAAAKPLVDVARLAWLRWLEAECARRPVVLALEDLQWCDLPSLEFVVAALEQLHDHPLLVLATTRPEGPARTRLVRLGPAVVALDLTALTARAGERLVRELLPDLDPARVEAVVRRSAGNVFFLEELVRVAGEDGADEAPATVLATVQARLLRLRELDRRLLRAGSVFGPRFTDAGVAAVAAVAIERVRPTLAALELQEMLTRAPDYRPGGPMTYVFSHQLAQEAAYATLTEGDRARAHRAAADWLAAEGAPDAGAVAHHYLLGGEFAQARQWFLRAAEGAFEAGDLDAAVRNAEQAAELGAIGTELGVVRLIQADASVWSGDILRGLEWAHDAVSLFSPGSIAHYRARARSLQIAAIRHDPDIITRLREAASSVPEPEALPGWVQYICDATYLAVWIGDEALATALLRRLDEVIDRPLPSLVRAAVARVRGIRGASTMEFTRAFAHFAEASASFTAAGDLRNACRCDMAIAHGHLLLGAFDDAEARLLAAGRVADKLGAALVRSYQRCYLAALYLQTGRPEQAFAVLQDGLRLSEPRGDQRGAGATEMLLAWYWLLLDQPARAEVLAREARARAGLQHPFMTASLGFLCWAVFAQGRHDEAAALADEFEARAPVDGMMVDFEPEFLRTLVAVRRATHGAEGAARALRRAADRIAWILARQSREHRDSFCRLPAVAQLLGAAREAGLASPPEPDPAHLPT